MTRAANGRRAPRRLPGSGAGAGAMTGQVMDATEWLKRYFPADAGPCQCGEIAEPHHHAFRRSRLRWYPCVEECACRRPLDPVADRTAWRKVLGMKP